MAGQLLRYCGVGVTAAVLHFGVLAILVEFAGAAAVSASLIAFVAGGIASYGLNRRYTFNSERSHRAAAPRFVAIAAGGFLLTGVAMHVLVVRLGLHYFPAQILTTLSVMLWTFSLNRVWTFGEGIRRQ